MDSAFFEHVAVVFHDDRVGRRCAIVTDSDRSLLDLPDDPAEDDEERKHCRSAQIIGEARRDSLARFTQGNSWLMAFFAEHTFEVDFLAGGNSPEVVASLDDIYQQQGAKQRAAQALESGDPVVAGREVLRIANKVGKGWFALLVSERLDAATLIPEYLLRALAFASEGLSRDAIKRIGLFRIDKDVSLQFLFLDVDAMRGLSADEFVTRYRQTAPDDQLTRLVTYLEEYE